jgi:abortive infection bacteriophage resistance protein
LVIYAKSAITPAALLNKLIGQNLHVANQATALSYISHIGYYRLKGYWFHLLDPSTKQFPAGTTFEHIIQRYEFDRELRAIILAACERLEVAVRNAICNHLSLHDSPHWYLNPKLFKPGLRFGFGQMLAKIEQEIGRSSEKKFIAAYYQTYDDPYMPPSWAMSECVSLGTWSRIYQILREPNDKKAVSAKFGVPETEVFTSWLHTLTVMRNLSAHHDRLLHTKLRVGPSNHKSKKIKFPDNKSIFAGLTVLQVLLASIGFDAAYKQQMLKLQADYGMGLLQELGFPRSWPHSGMGW